METTEKLLTVTQAAEMLQCSPNTIRRRIRAGELKVMRSGRILRIPESAIIDMMQQQTRQDSSYENAPGYSRRTEQ